ncbi:hypothetical protein F5Y18DRAFT_127090 [Xylariaceae sp. FL1019]|nr:hypothetical protein F5Y18DRAFT_127090 [Xylariaceae sp. FL1019]
MDRINGKTMDAYVEMPEHQARVLMYRIEQKRASGRALFLGRRPVNITLSTQAQLMKALFPHAHVDWHGAKPYVIRNSPWSFQNFKCFFTDEEMVMLAKHTNPTQSSFAKLCPERVYECMISTIRKLPWSQTDYINMAQRHLLFETAINMVKTLNKRLDFMEKRHKEQSSCPSPHPSATLVPIGSGGGGGAMQHGHNGYPTGPRAIMPPGNANQHGYGQFQSVQNNNGNVQGNMPLNFPHNLIADARGNGGGNGRRFGRANGRRNGGGHGRSDSQNVQGHAQGAQGVQGQASKEPKEDKPKDNRAPEEFYEGRLTEALRNRLAVTCMMCPGFTVVQKDWFGEVIGMAHEERSQLNLPYFSAGWLHLYSLCPKGGMPYDLLSVSHSQILYSCISQLTRIGIVLHCSHS